MASFVVLEHGGSPNETASEKTVFVRDNFAIWALATPIIWLAWHRLWVHAFVVFCAAIIILSLSQSALFVGAILPLNFMLGVLVALEGPAWRIASFRHQAYRHKGTVDADTLEDAQIIWAMDHADGLLDKPVAAVADRVQTNDLIFGGAA